MAEHHGLESQNDAYVDEWCRTGKPNGTGDDRRLGGHPDTKADRILVPSGCRPIQRAVVALAEVTGTEQIDAEIPLKKGCVTHDAGDSGFDARSTVDLVKTHALKGDYANA